MNAITMLIVDHDDLERERLRRILGEADGAYKVLTARSSKEAREWLRTGYFDCVFVSACLGGAEGVTLVPAINAHRGRASAATIIIGSGDEREIVAAMRGGAADYLSRASLCAEVVRRAIENGMCAAQHAYDLRDARARLNYLAMFDGRTGLPNRTLFCDRLNHAILAARRNRQSLAVMVMNLDFFKDVNDQFGRSAGDVVLFQIGNRIRNVMRGADTVARLHGDEFAALLPGVGSGDAAVVVAEKIIATAGTPIAIDKDQVTVSISIGIAMLPGDGSGPEALFDNADAAMYRAKRGTLGYAFHAPRGNGKATGLDQHAYPINRLVGE